MVAPIFYRIDFLSSPFTLFFSFFCVHTFWKLYFFFEKSHSGSNSTELSKLEQEEIEDKRGVRAQNGSQRPNFDLFKILLIPSLQDVVHNGGLGRLNRYMRLHEKRSHLCWL